MRHKYKFEIYYSAADAAYISSAPALPGCMADGKTLEESLINLDIIIDEWISVAVELGWPIPAPDANAENSSDKNFISPI